MGTDSADYPQSSRLFKRTPERHYSVWKASNSHMLQWHLRTHWHFINIAIWDLGLTHTVNIRLPWHKNFRVPKAGIIEYIKPNVYETLNILHQIMAKNNLALKEARKMAAQNQLLPNPQKMLMINPTASIEMFMTNDQNKISSQRSSSMYEVGNSSLDERKHKIY